MISNAQPFLPGLSVFTEDEFSHTSMARMTLGEITARNVDTRILLDTGLATRFTLFSRVLQTNIDKILAPLALSTRAWQANIDRIVSPMTPVLQAWQANLDTFSRSTAKLDIRSLLREVDGPSVDVRDRLQPPPMVYAVPTLVGRTRLEPTPFDFLMGSPVDPERDGWLHPDIIDRLRAARRSLYRDNDLAGVLMHCRNAIDMALDLGQGELIKTLRQMGLGRDVQSIIGRLYGFESNRGVHARVGDAPTRRDAEIVLRLTFSIVTYFWAEHGCFSFAARN